LTNSPNTRPASAISAKNDGPRTYLHLREIDGCPVLFDQDGRRLGAVKSVVIQSGMNEPVTATIEVILRRTPAIGGVES
jgi:hypothetical protein